MQHEAKLPPYVYLPLQTLDMGTKIRAANGKQVKALTVFARSIKFLKDEALNVICQRTGDNHYNADDIQWVLTVPAIWTPKAKQFMRKAAYEVLGIMLILLAFLQFYSNKRQSNRVMLGR